MKKIIIRRAETESIKNLSQLPALLARIYATRGVVSVADLERGLENLLPYQSLFGMETAVTCLEIALKQQQHMLILGDFDADGATSTALAVDALKNFGAKNISYLVPNRFQFGYGLTPEIVEVAAQKNPQLIITVDNGISSHAGVKRAQELNIKVLITDHHLPGSELPDADAIVNPNQPEDLFASKNLAGVGVIFYVMLALRARLREIHWFAEQNIAEPNMARYLDLVALGTVADVVTLDKNNRILIYQGMQRIRAGKARQGIYALLEVAGKQYQNLMPSDLGFIVAPRLNAAGRLDDMSLGIECLLCDDANKARDIAVRLDTLNRERQAIEVEMQQQAFKILNQLHFDRRLPVGLCLFDEKWHQGVVGILASRVKDQLHRPVIAFAKVSDNEIKGSARSVPGVHIRDVFTAIAARHPEVLTKFGGHAMAAGLSLQKNDYEIFCQLFDEEVKRYLSEDALHGKIYSDGELLPADFRLETVEMLRDAGPWGQGFNEPLFDGVFHLLDQRLVGQRHLKMILGLDNTKNYFDAIAFNIDEKIWPNRQCQKVLAAYRLDINEYRGQRNVQLLVEHLEPL